MLPPDQHAKAELLLHNLPQSGTHRDARAVRVMISRLAASNRFAAISTRASLAHH
jgi:hypothetical protein